jgi:hypothetical protein
MRRRRTMKHRKSLTGALFAAAVLVAPEAARAGEGSRLYVPWVDAHAGTFHRRDGVLVSVNWMSDFTLFNGGAEPATWRRIAIYSDGQLVVPDGSSACMLETEQTVPPDYGGYVGGCIATPPRNGLAMLVLDTSAALIANATVSLVHTPLNDCAGPGHAEIRQGRVPLPAFKGLFPPGSTVTFGEIDLGNPSIGYCAPPNQRYARRVNVTMFNGGDASATFRLRVKAGINRPEDFYEQTVVVGPKEIIQLNRLPLDLDEVASRTEGGSVAPAWVLLSADQPYVAYVSSVFEDPEPGAMPMEVYPPQRVE